MARKSKKLEEIIDVFDEDDYIDENELKKLENICNETMKKFLTNNEPIYKNKDLVINDIKSMNEKTANSSNRISSKNGEISKMNTMSIISIKNSNCEATEFIEDKTNEIPTGPELLKRINIENCLVVFDAMSTQTETIKYIVGKHGYYIAPVKGNQTTLEQNLKEYFEDTKLYEEAKENNYYCVNERAHGNSEKREYIFL